MALIYSYKELRNLSEEDLLVATDMDNVVKRNVSITLGDFRDWLSSELDIDVNGTHRTISMFGSSGENLVDSIITQSDTDNAITINGDLLYTSVLRSSTSLATGLKSVALGDDNLSEGDYSTTLGKFAAAIGVGSSAIGRSSKALGDYSFASGLASGAAGRGSSAIGYHASAGNEAAALFRDTASAVNGFVVTNILGDLADGMTVYDYNSNTKRSVTSVSDNGDNTFTVNIDGLPINTFAGSPVYFESSGGSDSDGAIAIGLFARSKGLGAVAIGKNAVAEGDDIIALGSDDSEVKIEGTATLNGHVNLNATITDWNGDAGEEGNVLTRNADGRVEWTPPATAPEYTNSTPMPETVGGYDAGTTFEGKTQDEMWTGLLYPYQVPQFTSFTDSEGVSGTKEVGQVIIPGSITFTYAASNESNIQNVEIEELSGDIAYDGPFSSPVSYVSTSQFSSATVTALTLYTLDGTNSNGGDMGNRSITATWHARLIYGKSPLTSLTEAQIRNLDNQQLITSNPLNTVLEATGGAGYLYVCIPVDLTSDIVDIYDEGGAFNIPWQAVNVNVTNQYSQVINYKVYRSTFEFNGTSFKFQLKNS